MDDYISRTEALAIFDDASPLDYNAQAYRNIIAELRVADVQPIKHGKWRRYESMLECMNCGAEFYDDIMEYLGDKVPKFCPECGADMRGEKNG